MRRGWLSEQIEEVTRRYALEYPPPQLAVVPDWFDMEIKNREARKAKSSAMALAYRKAKAIFRQFPLGPSARVAGSSILAI